MSDPRRPEREAIERLKVLLEQATPGPWHVHRPRVNIYLRNADGVYVMEQYLYGVRTESDAELICLLRNLAPALLAALPPTPTPGWQDISTAPKDGREILVRFEGTTAMSVVRWEPYPKADSGYWFCLDSGQQYDPTFWRPLPTAPTGGRE
jgi:hypothetical protein